MFLATPARGLASRRIVSRRGNVYGKCRVAAKPGWIPARAALGRNDGEWIVEDALCLSRASPATDFAQTSKIRIQPSLSVRF